MQWTCKVLYIILMWVYSYLKKITVYVCVLLQTDVWGSENSRKIIDGLWIFCQTCGVQDCPSGNTEWKEITKGTLTNQCTCMWGCVCAFVKPYVHTVLQSWACSGILLNKDMDTSKPLSADVLRSRRRSSNAFKTGLYGGCGGGGGLSKFGMHQIINECEWLNNISCTR